MLQENLNINDLELLKDLVKSVRSCHSDDEALELVLKDFGGSALYIHSYKSTLRNEHIYNDFKAGVRYKALSRKYDLSEVQVRRIVKDMQQPSLF